MGLAAKKVEYLLWKDLNTKFFNVDKNENNERIIELHRLFRKNWKYFITNNMFSKKEKLAICVFCINPELYQHIWRK